MIALDTNVVLRLVMRDDVAQSAAAEALIRRARAEGARLFIADVVLCELVWVLRAAYRRSRADIAETLDTLAAVAQAEFEAPERLTAALAAFRAGRGDFADYLIREHGHRGGADFVATFDQQLLGEDGFVHPDPGGWGAGTTLHEDAPGYGRRGRRREPPRRAVSAGTAPSRP